MHCSDGGKGTRDRLELWQQADIARSFARSRPIVLWDQPIACQT